MAGELNVRRRPAWWRAPFLLFGFVALFTGIGAGLARLGWAMPDVAASAAALHGPLMVCGFFGTVIALERAVAIGHPWAYAAPALTAAGNAVVLHGAAPVGRWLWLAGAVALLAASLHVFRRQRETFTFTMAVAAACFVAGTLQWARGAPVHQVVPWWLAFLVLTIAGERLELSRFLPPSATARRVFTLLLAACLTGLTLSAQPWGRAAFGLSLFGLAAWLLKQDIARRTVRQQGLTRFIAVCLLSGYVFLALGGALVAASPSFEPGAPGYDAALHALLLGFVFAMVFGHAPIIFPAVLRVQVPYRPVFYAPLLLLQASVLVRLAGDAGAGAVWVRAGGLLSALALLAFVLGTVGSIVAGSRQRARGGAEPPTTAR